MGVLHDCLGWLIAKRREKVVDEREITKSLASELDTLADLMSDLLEATDSDGHIQKDVIPDLERRRERVWGRWISILGTEGYATRDSALQEEIEGCIKIAHAAPSAYVEEIHLVQVGTTEGYVPKEVCERFARSIDRIQNLTTRMRIDA